MGEDYMGYTEIPPNDAVALVPHGTRRVRGRARRTTATDEQPTERWRLPSPPAPMVYSVTCPVCMLTFEMPPIYATPVVEITGPREMQLTVEFSAIPAVNHGCGGPRS